MGTSRAAQGLTDSPTKRQKKANGQGVKTSAEQMVDYLNDCWTPFHATETSAKMLEEQGFQKICERECWKGELQQGGKYYFTRNGSTIVAFAVGGQFKGGGGFRVIGAHTDSPCPKLKPNSKQTKAGYLMINCQNYGGGLWYTWFDRDLSVAGRVVLREGGKLVTRLVQIDRPIMRIPSLAIHLNRTVNDGFKVNFQQHMSPVLASAITEELEKKTNPELYEKAENKAANDNSEAFQQHPMLLGLMAQELGCEVGDIVDFELQVCDTQPSAIGGAKNEFVFSGRLDNLAMSFCSLRSLLDSLGSLGSDETVRVVTLFDHEECGSCSAQGAGSTVMMDTVKRVSTAFSNPAQQSEDETVAIALQKSFLVSADMAHALHPNYQDRHEPQHGPAFHKGIVIKHNANQRYATNSITASAFRECAKRRGIPCQEFVVRSDMGCGSTIGPIVASRAGMRTVDVGIPQWSMHSVREMCGCDDVDYAVRHFKAFWDDMPNLDSCI